MMATRLAACGEGRVVIAQVEDGAAVDEIDTFVVSEDIEPVWQGVSLQLVRAALPAKVARAWSPL